MLRPNSRLVNIVLPLVVFVTLSIITIVLCHQYAEHDEEIIRRHTQSTAERIRVRIQDFIEERLSSLEVLVDRWVERTPLISATDAIASSPKHISNIIRVSKP